MKPRMSPITMGIPKTGFPLPFLVWLPHLRGYRENHMVTARHTVVLKTEKITVHGNCAVL